MKCPKCGEEMEKIGLVYICNKCGIRLTRSKSVGVKVEK